MTPVNQGTIVATGDSALIMDTGTNVVTNSGTLEATGSGGLVVESGLANTGSLWANGGNVVFHGDVTGAGNATISGAATLEFGGLSSEDVVFDVNGNATLKLDQAALFTGAVSGFGSGGTLTASDGTYTANIVLVGQYTPGDFAVATDGGLGTLIHGV